MEYGGSGWDSIKGKFVKCPAKQVGCHYCGAGFDARYNRAKELLEAYAGNNATTREYTNKNGTLNKKADDLWLGAEGRELRRLLIRLWAQKPNTKEITDSRPGSKTTPFKKLFKFERKPKPYPWLLAVNSTIPAAWCVKVNPKDLLAAIIKAGAVVDNNSTIPIFQCVRLDAIDGALRITGTDLETWSGAECAAEIRCGATFILNYRKLKAVIDGMKRFEYITLTESIPSWVTIEAGRTQFKLLSMDAENWPTDKRTPQPEAEFEITLK